MKPAVGTRFRHSRVVNWDDHKTPALYQVTKVARGTVFYKAVYDAGTFEERLGSSECCCLEYFPKVCLSVEGGQ